MCLFPREIWRRCKSATRGHGWRKPGSLDSSYSAASAAWSRFRWVPMTSQCAQTLDTCSCPTKPRRRSPTKTWGGLGARPDTRPADSPKSSPARWRRRREGRGRCGHHIAERRCAACTGHHATPMSRCFRAAAWGRCLWCRWQSTATKPSWGRQATLQWKECVWWAAHLGPRSLCRANLPVQSGSSSLLGVLGHRFLWRKKASTCEATVKQLCNERC